MANELLPIHKPYVQVLSLKRKHYWQSDREVRVQRVGLDVATFGKLPLIETIFELDKLDSAVKR